MSNRPQLAAGLAGLVLIVIYSWIMMASSGSTSWAWLILLGGVVMLVWSARLSSTNGTDGGESDGSQ